MYRLWQIWLGLFWEDQTVKKSEGNGGVKRTQFVMDWVCISLPFLLLCSNYGEFFFMISLKRNLSLSHFKLNVFYFYWTNYFSSLTVIQFLTVCSFTYQADQEEENLESTTSSSDADDVPVPHRRHGHHQEIDAIPVGERLRTWRLEVGGVALVLQLGGQRILMAGDKTIPGLYRPSCRQTWLMLGYMNQKLGSGCWGTEARHHATRKWFEHAPIFKSSSEAPLQQKSPCCRRMLMYISIKWQGLPWVQIQQKSASLYNFSS